MARTRRRKPWAGARTPGTGATARRCPWRRWTPSCRPAARASAAWSAARGPNTAPTAGCQVGHLPLQGCPHISVSRTSPATTAFAVAVAEAASCLLQLQKFKAFISGSDGSVPFFLRSTNRCTSMMMGEVISSQHLTHGQRLCPDAGGLQGDSPTSSTGGDLPSRRRIRLATVSPPIAAPSTPRHAEGAVAVRPGSSAAGAGLEGGVAQQGGSSDDDASGRAAIEHLVGDAEAAYAGSHRMRLRTALPPDNPKDQQSLLHIPGGKST